MQGSPKTLAIDYIYFLHCDITGNYSVFLDVILEVYVGLASAIDLWLTPPMSMPLTII